MNEIVLLTPKQKGQIEEFVRTRGSLVLNRLLLNGEHTWQLCHFFALALEHFVFVSTRQNQNNTTGLNGLDIWEREPSRNANEEHLYKQAPKYTKAEVAWKGFGRAA